MADRSSILVHDYFNLAVDGECKRLKLTKIKYIEACGNYFITRQLNPTKIKEGETLEIQRHVTSEINRVIGFMVRNEEVYLREITKNTLVSEAKSDILLNTMFNLFNVSKEEYQNLSELNRSLLVKKMEEINARILEMSVLVKKGIGVNQKVEGKKKEV